MKAGGKFQLGYAAGNSAVDWFDKEFTASPGKWVGARIGLYMLRNNITNDAGYVDVDAFRIGK